MQSVVAPLTRLRHLITKLDGKEIDKQIRRSITDMFVER